MIYNELDLNLIKTFVAVSEAKTISEASEKLFVSQPAVTTAIKKLETTLNIKLLLRTNKGILLTKEGESFYTSCKKSLNEIENGIMNLNKFTKLEKGHINIGCTSTIVRNLIIDFISIFSKKYPKVTITITDGASDILLKNLNDGKIDFAILSSPYYSNTKYKNITLTQTHDCFIANKEYAYLKNKIVNKEELKQLPLILQKQSSNNRKFFNEMCKNNNINLIPKLEMESFWLITDFVKRGTGIGYSIREFLRTEFDKNDIFEIKTDLNIEPRDIVLTLPDNSSINFATSVFIEEIQAHFKN